MVRAGIDPQVGFAVVTSRASYEMVMKAAQAGITLLAAISAPTALAIALAESSALTLVGFAREHGHVVSAHARRLRGMASGVAAWARRLSADTTAPRAVGTRSAAPPGTRSNRPCRSPATGRRCRPTNG